MKVKKMLSFVLMMVLLACLPVLAEEDEDALAAAALTADTAAQIDLDGDGTPEQVLWHSTVVGEYQDETVQVEVTSADGETAIWTSDLLWGAQVYAVDLDSDGKTELFISGDEMSDDYVTFCLRYEGGELVQLLFADANRGDNTDGYYLSGYGEAVLLGDNRITLCGSQDVLGTYMSNRTFTLKNGRFEFADDGLWHMVWQADGADSWEYGALTLKQPLDVTFTADGTETAGTLNAGEQLRVTASDKVSVVYFETPDGRTGYFGIMDDFENGWGSLVNGVSEEEMFEFLPYAD